LAAHVKKYLKLDQHLLENNAQRDDIKEDTEALWEDKPTEKGKFVSIEQIVFEKAK
jgi:hypothetical protein